MDVYVTDHPHSQIVCRAFGKVRPVGEYKGGPAVVYGILRGCGDIVRRCEKSGRDYYFIDLGYFKRGHYAGYYRVTKNALQADGSGSFPSDRWDKLGIVLKPWRRGSKIIVCPPSQHQIEWFGLETWLEDTLGQIDSDREVVVKTKSSGPLDLACAHILVTFASNAAVDAVVGGVPVISLGPCAANQVSGRLSDINEPLYPDREQWAANLAYGQFTLEEMRDGTAWRILNQ